MLHSEWSRNLWPFPSYNRWRNLHHATVICHLSLNLRWVCTLWKRMWKKTNIKTTLPQAFMLPDTREGKIPVYWLWKWTQSSLISTWFIRVWKKKHVQTLLLVWKAIKLYHEKRVTLQVKVEGRKVWTEFAHSLNVCFDIWAECNFNERKAK